ncbi:hypothetical protein [Pseudidiomarina mangrovi]|uniref:hypothetical protein n=1 Tax=Pseudidiomarina mangrovi TaxID=2487133 RepID=UPI0013E01AE7|nr:hypothetical protein [Pseudidiomarina mangrovi]
MTSKKQEFGSFYEETVLVFSDSTWTDEDSVFLGSGRDALYAVIRSITSINEAEQREFTIWMPSYYCHPITSALAREYNVKIYPSTPYKPVVTTNAFKATDIVVVPEYFGNPSRLELNGNPIVVLDKTHNPASDFRYSFDVDYEFGSLRKILPIADGGYLKLLSIHSQSPLHTPSATDNHLNNFQRVSLAMSTKSLYLQNKVAEKNGFLNTFSECESAFGDVRNPSGSVMPDKQLSHLDMTYYLGARRQNNKLLASILSDSFCYVELIDDDVFFIIGFKDNNAREQVKKSLIEKDVYPAVLWPVDDQYMTEADKVFSQRMLVIPTDFRYGEHEIFLLAKILKQALEGIDVVN